MTLATEVGRAGAVKTDLQGRTDFSSEALVHCRAASAEITSGF